MLQYLEDIKNNKPLVNVPPLCHDYVELLLKYCGRYGDAKTFASIVTLITDQYEYATIMLECASYNNMTLLRHIVSVFNEAKVTTDFTYELLRTAVYVNLAAGHIDVYRYCRRNHSGLVLDNTILIKAYQSGSLGLLNELKKLPGVNASKMLYLLSQDNVLFFDTYGIELFEEMLYNGSKYGYVMTIDQIKMRLSIAYNLDSIKLESMLVYAESKLADSRTYLAESLETLYKRSCEPITRNVDVAMWLNEQKYITECKLPLDAILKLQDFAMFKKYIVLQHEITRDDAFVENLMFSLFDVRGLRDNYMQDMLNMYPEMQDKIKRTSNYILTRTHITYAYGVLPYIDQDAFRKYDFTKQYTNIHELYLPDLEDIVLGTSYRVIYLQRITDKCIEVCEGDSTYIKNIIDKTIADLIDMPIHVALLKALHL